SITYTRALVNCTTRTQLNTFGTGRLEMCARSCNPILTVRSSMARFRAGTLEIVDIVGAACADKSTNIQRSDSARL
ncbi:MAG: hypothetical protein JWO42_1678, partial [Chloroflexi bacterium]|nr:hypothetical protein [Chloroflexota bacterium]